MVCKWKHWMFHWMAHTIGSSGCHSANGNYSPHPIGLSHFIKATHSQSKFNKLRLTLPS